jgi:hypothetical protein
MYNFRSIVLYLACPWPKTSRTIQTGHRRIDDFSTPSQSEPFKQAICPTTANLKDTQNTNKIKENAAPDTEFIGQVIKQSN